MTSWNAQWLHYLVLKLLHSKRLRPPTVRKTTTSSSISSSTFTERECYDSLVEMEVVLRTAVQIAKKPAKAKQGRPRKTVAVGVGGGTGPKSAEEVLEVGSARGWVRR